MHLDKKSCYHSNQLEVDLEENAIYCQIHERSVEAPIVSAAMKSLCSKNSHRIDIDSDSTKSKSDNGLMNRSRSNVYARRCVQHDYHDHSQDDPPSEEWIACSYSSIGQMNAMLPSGSKRQNARHRDSTTLFPLKLHKLLSMVEMEGLSSIISWQVHGRAFKIHKPKEFLEKVMPIHFHQTKIASFRRQLNLYGFLRITKGLDKGAYYHEYFLRGMIFLSSRCIRQRVKGTMVKGVSSPETEPDFYSMPFLGSVDHSSKDNVSLPERSTSTSGLTVLSSPNFTSPAVKRGVSDNNALQPYKIILNMEEKSFLAESSHSLGHKWETIAKEEWDVETFSLDDKIFDDMLL
jgi:hypothetical protein